VSAHSASTSKKSGDVDTTALAERFFSLRERAGIEAWPDHLATSFAAGRVRKASRRPSVTNFLSTAGFFRHHTPRSLDLQLEDIKGDTAAGKHWFLADLSVVDRFPATVAVERAYCDLETYAWT
jgi:hypothetical protein